MEWTYDINMFKETFETSFTYLQGFMRNVRRYGFKTAMFDPEINKSWTYKELNIEANKLAHALEASGVGRHDLVLYQLLNCAEFVFCYIAPQKIGAINSPMNFKLAAGETALLIETSQPKVYIYDAEIKDIVVEALGISKFKPEHVIMVDYKERAELPEGHIRYEDYVSGQSEEDPVMAVPAHIYDEVTRLYTSGTTNLPKGVPMNNINEVLSAHDVLMHYPLNPTDKTMNMTPWFHRGGLHSGGPNSTLYAGGEMVINRQFHPQICLEYVEKYKITFLMGVPSILNMLAKTQERKHYDLSSLKGIVTMGSPLEKSACIRFQEVLSPNIFNGYGTTESFWNTFLRPYDLPEMAGTAGHACTDDEVLVVEAIEDGKAEPNQLVPQDNETVGEIIIKSPAKSSYCYSNNPEQTKAKFYKGFMYTGDLGVWDENQFITIVGRKDDMIIVAGENIYPTQIEEILNEHPDVADCIVTSVPDKSRGESIVAYIVAGNESLQISDLTKYCVEHPMMAPYKRPRYYRFVDSIPMNATGKKMHYKAKEMAKDDLNAGLLKRS